MLKVVCISDLHMTWDHLIMPKEADVLLFTGDGTDSGTEEQLIKLNNWLAPLRYKHKLYIPGNHDIMFEEDEARARTLLSSCTVLIDEAIEIEGKKFYGSPYTPTFFDWAFMKPDLNLQKVWDKIPANLDVLATHGPPYSILDRNVNGYCCGSQTLYLEVQKKEPRFHVFGHIHEGYGSYTIEDTTFINASCPNYVHMGQRQRQPVLIEV